MSILENNFNAAVNYMEELVEKERNEATSSGYFVVQVACNENSFELYSAALMPTEDETVPRELLDDPYYNLVYTTRGLDTVVKQFRDKYMFKLAYADIMFALHQAYRGVLTSETGEYSLKTSFYRPGIKDSAWAYKDVFHYTDLGRFLCWFNYDDEYKEVEIQAENDFIKSFDTSDMPSYSLYSEG